MRRVLVLGGGPAGLAAACSALEAGAEVVLVDEAERLGGQFWRHREGLTDARLQHGWREFTRLRNELAKDVASGRAEVLSGAAVWRVEADERVRLRLLRGPTDAPARASRVIEGDALVLATGAYDRALPVPGWTLPGVTTAGAAQALAKRDGVTVGRRTVVAGAGPFLLPVAQSLLLAGSAVPEVLEASALPRIASGWSARPWELLGSPGKALELGGYAAALTRGRVRYRPGHGVVRVHGDTRVEGVTTARLDADWQPVPGTEREIDCDAVALGHGFTPRLEAALQAGALVRGGFVVVDADQRTSRDGVFAAGEITGIGGSDLARAEGELAGCAAAGAPEERLATARRRVRRLSGFVRRIERAHGIRPGWQSWIESSTIICRCESVSAGDIRALAGESERARRLATRAGLGACQGRTCGEAVAALIDAGGGRPDAAPGRRTLLAPLRFGELADAGSQSAPSAVASPAEDGVAPHTDTV